MESDMKTKIWGLLAVGLLVGPLAANAAVINYAGNAGADGSYLTIQAVVSSTSQGVRDPGSGLESWLMTAFTAGGAVQGIVDSQDPLFVPAAGFGQFISFDASGSVDAWELIGLLTGGSGGTCFNCWSGYQSSFGEYDYTGTASIFNRGTWTIGTSVPEPGTLSLLGLSLAGLGLSRRKNA